MLATCDRLNKGVGESLLHKLEIVEAPTSKGGAVARAVQQLMMLNTSGHTRSGLMLHKAKHYVQKRGKPKPIPKPEGQKGPDVNCKYCGQTHEKAKKKCPAFGKTYSKCSKPNHFATVCQSKAKQVNQLEAEDEDSSTEEVLLVADNKALSKIFVTMLVNRTPLKFQVNSGTTCNVIPAASVPQGVHLEQSEMMLALYNKSTIHALGKCQIRLINPKKQEEVQSTFGWSSMMLQQCHYLA